MKQIRKAYNEINPELLYAEARDFILKQGDLSLDENNLETYTLPDESATFVSRGTLTFRNKTDSAGKECLRVHIVGSARGETKLMLDIDEKLFPDAKLAALMDDLDFVFASQEED